MSKKRKATIYDYALLCEKNQCEECPLNDRNNGCDCGCGACILFHSDKANEIILKWCNEYPVKTYSQDFKEKFPKARLDANGVPNGICINNAYGLSIECPGDCSDCWNRPMEGSDE